jgi:hypothetical protein
VQLLPLHVGEEVLLVQAIATDWPHGHLVHLNLLRAGEHVGALALRCMLGCPYYPELGCLDVSELENRALQDIAVGQLHAKLLSGVASSQALRVAGNQSHLGRVIFDWHGDPSEDRMEQRTAASGSR